MQLKIRKCSKADLDQLTKISKETFIAAFEHDNNPEDFNRYIDTAFSRATIMGELSEEHSQFFFAYLEDELVAYFKLNTDKAQNELQEPFGIELERIYVIGLHQGRNIGSRILDEIHQLALKMRKKYIWLGVWERNHKAIRFYERHGYVKFGKHPYFIGNDEQTDWLMRKDL